MKRSNLQSIIIPAVIFFSMFLAGCGSTSKVATSTGEAVAYKFTEGKSYTYSQNSTMLQTIIYMGQEMGATVNSAIKFTLRAEAPEDGVNVLGVTIDSLGVAVKSAQGNFASDVKEIIGRSFTMKLSPTGIESDLAGAADLKYSLAGQETNLEATFKMFFPDMPSESLTEGYTWTDTDTLDMSAGTDNATMMINSSNTVSGREKVKGYDCLVINSVMTGTRDASSNTPQGNISSTGEITGTGTYYFAPAEGLLLKDHTKIKVDGSLFIPTGESLPIIIESEYTTELIK